MEPKTVVSPEDQKKINEFARLYDREQQLGAKILALKKSIGALEDAESALIESDEPKIPVKVGTVFFHSTPESATETVEKQLAKAQEEQTIANAQIAGVRAQMAALRQQLYATFGDNISLEVDDESRPTV
uniref:Prefoldin subunit n=1 Tax=Panagrellus redivivus TaxID=6233 RepID=A0A7E4VIU1_PANRE